MKNFILWAMKVAMQQGLVSEQDVETLLQQTGGKASVELKKTDYLKQLLFVGENIRVNPTDGMKTIAQASDVFTWGIDLDFGNWGLTHPSQSTGMASAAVYELIEDGSFMDIFRSLGEAVDKVCFTQNQIIDFVENNQGRLRQDGYSTFFLFKKDDTILAEDDHDNLFVARVDARSGGNLDVGVGRFSRDFRWFAGCHHRFVVPQLAA